MQKLVCLELAQIKMITNTFLDFLLVSAQPVCYKSAAAAANAPNCTVRFPLQCSSGPCTYTTVKKESEVCILSAGLSSPVKTVLCLWRHSSYTALESSHNNILHCAKEYMLRRALRCLRAQLLCVCVNMAQEGGRVSAAFESVPRDAVYRSRMHQVLYTPLSMQVRSLCAEHK